MKKLIALLLCACLCAAFASPVFAAPLSAGQDALRAEFRSGDDGGLDYRYFAPSGADGAPYPLVVWLHGIASGNYEGDQIDSYDFCNWASDEFQARFEGAGGAFLLAPRCPGGWELTTPAALKSCVDAFIARFPGQIDQNRIYLCGFSVGATMVLKTASRYPGFFAAAVPISAVVQDAGQVKALKNTAVWFFANEKDAYVGANAASTQKSFDTLRAVAADRSRIRFTSVSKAVTPSGADVSPQHYMWRIFTNDMFMDDRTPYAFSSTVDGNGAAVAFTYPDGVIRWLSRQTVQAADGAARTGFFSRLAALFQKIIGFFKNLFQGG